MTINKIRDKDIAFIVGAPEIILSFCDIPINEKNNILAKIDNWASQGLRIVGAIFKDKGELKEKQGYIWLGLLGIEDPIREGVKEAISIAKEAGIKIKIVTGDYRKTAEKIAAKLGFNLKTENILEGQELEKISEESLKRKIDDIILFTRVTPHQKLKIVKVLQEKGEIVAMTGDGVNDAPALKKADIGVVVGGASDVAKEAGDLILLDSNFKTIVAACEGGRLILSNIKKVVGYVLSNSFAEIVLILGTILLDLPAPLTVVQILWIHLI
jgi:Ca2+-transporting ATPase